MRVHVGVGVFVRSCVCGYTYIHKAQREQQERETERARDRKRTRESHRESVCVRACLRARASVCASVSVSEPVFVSVSVSVSVSVPVSVPVSMSTYTHKSDPPNIWNTRVFTGGELKVLTSRSLPSSRLSEKCHSFFSSEQQFSKNIFIHRSIQICIN